MKVSRFFMWLVGIINTALVLILLLGSTPDKTALNAADTIPFENINSEVTYSKNTLKTASQKLDTLTEKFADIESLTANYELTVSGSTQLAPTKDTGEATQESGGTTIMFDANGEQNQVAEIRSTYIIQQVCSRVDDFMSYSDVTMPSVTRSFSADVTETEMIEALVARFSAEHDAHGCGYFRIEYKGVQYNKVGTAEYVFCLYFS